MRDPTVPIGRRRLAREPRGAPGAARVVCFVLCAVGPPAMAQTSPAGDGVAGAARQAIAMAKRLVEQRELAGEMRQLTETLRERLARRPRHGATARAFDAAMARPLRFAEPLAAFHGRLARHARLSARDAWAVFLPALLDDWRRQYGAGESCAPAPLAPPNSLSAALRQIEALAARTATLQRQAVSAKDRRRLAADYERFGRLWRDALPTALRGRDRRLFSRFLARLDAADMAAALCAAEHWLRLADPAWLARLRALMRAHPAAADQTILRRETPLGEIALRGLGGGRLRVERPLFIADLGGDDFYGIGGAGFDAAPRFLVDFDGDDRYESSLPGGYAAGMGRVDLLIDYRGDDRYAAALYAQGSAALGVGALIDLAGDDRYLADAYGQGAALYGVGALLDLGGDDRYRARAFSQGAGLPGGLGVLADAAGDDVYAAAGGAPTNYGTPGLADAWAQGVGIGARGLAAGGVGVLADHGGADRYDAGSFAQGGGYYRGVGQLWDLGPENDALLGSRYNAGWGAHGGAGLFFNAAGDDRYDTRHAVLAGLAWDYGVALFHDGGGDDFYRGGHFSLGAAAHASVGWFVDDGGDDAYVDAPRRADGGTAGPNFALFLNRGGAAQRCRYRPRHGFEVWTSGAPLRARCEFASQTQAREPTDR